MSTSALFSSYLVRQRTTTNDNDNDSQPFFKTNAGNSSRSIECESECCRVQELVKGRKKEREGEERKSDLLVGGEISSRNL